MELFECVDCTSVENDYIFAIWKLFFWLKKKRLDQLKMEQGSSTKAFDTILQTKCVL